MTASHPEVPAARVRAGALGDFCTRILVAASGMPRADARAVSDNLVFANLRGIDTHGVNRLAVYLEFIKGKMANVDCDIRIRKDNGATVLVDADNAMGQVGAKFGMDLAVSRCRDHGVSWVSVANSGHIGALAHWAMMALEHGMIGICFTSTSTIMAAHGSREKTLGNTPLAVAVPCGGEMPVVLDMALSVAARGHLSVAFRENRPIPPGWAMDAQGVPTCDPGKGLEGSVLPIGGYKGSDLALMIEVLTAVLSGSPCGSAKGSLVPPDRTRPLGLSHVFACVRIDNFIPVPLFESRMTTLVSQVKHSRRAKNATEVLVPNEKEFRTEAQRKKEGIPLSDTLLKELLGLARTYGVPLTIET